jgi:methyl-accepting chemotaxis protein
MSLFRGIQGKLILVIALALIVPTTVLGYLTYQQTEIINYSAVIGKKDELEKVSSTFSEIFEEAEQTMESIATKPEVQYTSFTFTNGADIETSHMPAGNEPIPTNFYNEFFAPYSENPYIMNAYMGTSTGALYLSPLPPSDVDLTGYDPRTRGWYEAAIASPGQFVWTEPYIDAASGDSTMTLARTLHDSNGEVIGVLGLDLEMNQLALLMRDNIKSNTLYITLISFVVGIILIYFFIRSFSRKIYTLRDGMAALGEGDYTHRVNVKGKDELAELGLRFNHMADSTQSLLNRVLDSTKNVTQSANEVLAQTQTYTAHTEEISRAIEEIASGATNQASSAEENARLIHELAEMVNQLQEDSTGAATFADQTESLSSEGVNKLSSLEKLSSEATNKNQVTVETIQQLSKKSNQVGEITKIITELSEQTNLLALNAAIEAARAGEHGRGFAVVADEVRKLAEESGKSAANIEEIISDIQKEIQQTIKSMDEMKHIVEEQNSAVGETKLSFEEITKAVEETTDRIQRISGSIQQVNAKKDGMLSSIESMSAISEETAAGAEEVSATTDEQRNLIKHLLQLANNLEATADQLEEEIKKFKLS